MTRFPEQRAAFAFFDFILCVGVVLPLAVVLFMVARSMINGSVQDQPPHADTTATVSDYLRTVEHDGHWFVGPRRAGGLLHHPDCPCGKAEEEK
jgi:hypothetical protein